MSAERGGLLKNRAEEFARHLQTRLRSLSSSEDNGWAEVLPTDSEIYYDIDSSLASPQEEVSEPIFIAAQNRDSLTLQRSESSGSEYFDTEEDFPPSSSNTSESFPALKKIPILHLKTERPATLTNGHTNILDADFGCSKVREIDCEDVESSINEEYNVEKEDCDNTSDEVHNNNTWKEVEEVINKVDKIDLENSIVHCNGEVVTFESDSKSSGNDLLIDENTECEAIGSVSCVFCDIEQAKSNFSNRCAALNDSCTDETTDSSVNKKPDNLQNGKLHLQVPSDPNSEGSSDSEEQVPLKDLLQVLKNEISKDSIECESSQKEDTKVVENSPSLTCPSIEIRESTPTESATTNSSTSEDKDEEIFDIETKRKNFRRCSSLKSGKTPPGTPGRKKIVRFADVMGLDLADVKTFLDEVPTVPKSAYSDLQLSDSDSSTSLFTPSPSPSKVMTIVTPQPERVLVPLFQQPCLQPNFMDRVRANNVCLESAAVSDMSLFAITGVVRVKNIDFNKSVYIRYSINGWRSYADLQARYVPNSCDGFSDKFSFVLYAHTLSVGQRIEFAVRYQTAGTQFWDSNGGLNYIFECTTIHRPFNDPAVPPSPMETWASFL